MRLNTYSTFGVGGSIVIKAVLPANEARRLQILRDYYMLDTSAELAFDAITAAASVVCGTPIALITLVDENRQWFKSRVGLDATETPRDIAFCAHAVASGSMLEVPDALQDVRFVDNPLVVNEPNIRFYAGAPLTSPEGLTIGTLCVLDREPRQLNEMQRNTLGHLAAAIIALMEDHKSLAHQSLLGRIADAADLQILLIDASDGHLVHANLAALDALGYAKDEQTDVDAAQLIQNVCGRPIATLIEDLQQAGSSGLEIDAVLRRRDGSSYPVEGRVQSWRQAQNHLCMLAMFDVSRRRAMEGQLQDSELRLRTVTDNLPAMIAEVGSDLRYRFCNAAYAQVFGGTPAAMVGAHLNEVGDPGVFKAISEHVGKALAGTPQTFEGEMKIGTRNYQYESHFIPNRAADGSVRGFFAMTYDIGERKRMERVLRELATHDALTGLPNRTQLQEHFSAAMARSMRQRTSCALLFLDVDKFKLINDNHGHATGDRVLRTVAERLKTAIRASDLAARLAGDEFVIVAEGLHSESEAGRIADNVLRSMSHPFAIESGELSVGISIGIALWPDQGESLGDVLQAADTALYAAKSAGRGVWRMADKRAVGADSKLTRCAD